MNDDSSLIYGLVSLAILLVTLTSLTIGVILIQHI